MVDQNDRPRDPAWYRDRWQELTALFPDASPDEVIGQVRAVRELQTSVDAHSPAELADAVDALRERVETLEQQRATLRDAGFDRPEVVLQAIDSMQAQLDELYGEKEAAERTDASALLQGEGDTFDQLQALLAREEKLQRELGVSDPGQVVEMVEGLTDQLEDLYADREGPGAPAPPPNGDASAAEQVLEEEIGLSDPEAVAAMLNDLTDQLDALYDGRERLAELDLSGPDDAVVMVESMQEQLEALYEKQVRLSAHGIDGIDQALSVIESMEAQLNELYGERRSAAGTDDASGPAPAQREELEQERATLAREKGRLRRKRDRLRAQLEKLEAALDDDAPAANGAPLRDGPPPAHDADESDAAAPSPPLSDDVSLLPEDTLSRLADLDAEALNALPVGVFCVDDRGVVQRANDGALRWPDLTAEAPDALAGTPFFDDLAPAANTDLFRGRFEDGVEAGSMDETFFYTYVGTQSPPTNLTVHLYSSPDQSGHWIVFQVPDRW